MYSTQSLPVHYRYNLKQRTLAYISSPCRELYGYTVEELVGEQSGFFDSLIVPGDIPIVKAKPGLCAEEHGVQTVFYHIQTKCGRIKRISDRFLCVRNPENEVIAIEGVVAEASLQQQNIYDELIAYRDAININTIVSITDLRGTILYANEKFCEVSKYTRDELIGKNHRIINSGHHPKSFFSQMWQTIFSGKAWHGEIQNRAKDGSQYWVDSVIMPIRGPRQRITSYLSIRTLITDRKNAEAQQQLHLHNLQEMVYFISHNFRGPICSLLGLVNLMALQEHECEANRELVLHLIKASNNLEEVAQKLSLMINRFEIDFKKGVIH